MARSGYDGSTGKIIHGWDHCAHSLQKILTTEVGECNQRRGFGADHGRMIDTPQNLQNVLALYVSVVQAIEPRKVEGREYGEPGYVLTQVSVDASIPGTVSMHLQGVFFENGHLGDYSNPVPKSLNFNISEAVTGG